MIICPHIPKYKYIGIAWSSLHAPVKIAWYIGAWTGKHGKLPVHVIDVVTDWSYALV